MWPFRGSELYFWITIWFVLLKLSEHVATFVEVENVLDLGVGWREDGFGDERLVFGVRLEGGGVTILSACFGEVFLDVFDNLVVISTVWVIHRVRTILLFPSILYSLISRMHSTQNLHFEVPNILLQKVLILLILILLLLIISLLFPPRLMTLRQRLRLRLDGNSLWIQQHRVRPLKRPMVQHLLPRVRE